MSTQPPPPALQRPRLIDDYDLQACPEVAWVVDVELPRPMHRDRFMPLFPTAWRLENDVSLHAFCPDSGLWTYPDTAGVPERYTRLQLGLALSEAETDHLGRIVDDVRARLETVGVTAIEPRGTIEDAIARSEVLGRVLDELHEVHVGVVVGAENGIGLAMDDVALVMRRLGLEEHEEGYAWLNDVDAPGDETLFVVEPEGVEGRTCRALRFSFHVARSAAPMLVLDEVVRAAAYTREALRGVLLGLDGGPWDEASARAVVVASVERLVTAGLQPGAYATMTVF